MTILAPTFYKPALERPRVVTGVCEEFCWGWCLEYLTDFCGRKASPWKIAVLEVVHLLELRLTKTLIFDAHAGGP